MRVYTHPACLGHEPGPAHPERPARLQAVLDALRGAYEDLDWQEAPEASLGDLRRVHAQSLLDTVLARPEAPTPLDPDTVLAPGTPAAALRAAGAAVAAVDAVMHGQAETAFCAVRPPGHHATADTAMGFCFFNNVAVAAAHARERHGLERVAIADFDVHHGNGTQALFQHDPHVAYVSSHEAGIYPHSGSAHERGVGNVRNMPLPPGSDSLRFRNAWTEVLLPAVESFRPQLLLVSAGFDAHLRDPLADLMLTAEDFAWLTAELRAIARRHAGGRVVSLLEGGYDLQALAECSVAHVGALR